MQGHTIYFDNRPKIIATATVAGPKETEGIVGKYVDLPLNNDMFNEETYEKAERKMLAYAIEKSIQNANLAKEKVDLLISGDLLNQIISASFAARQFGIPFLGVYSACSTMSEAFALSASMVNAGYADTVVAATGAIFLRRSGSTAILWNWGWYASPAVAVDGNGSGKRGHFK